MAVEDLTKALYFLNATDYKDLVNITKIEKELVWFSNGEMYPVQVLANCYDNYIRTGEIVKLTKASLFYFSELKFARAPTLLKKYLAKRY